MHLPETIIKHPSESRLYDVRCAPNLGVGETISGVTSVAPDEVTTPTLDIANISVNALQVTYKDGTTEAPYTVIQFRASGGLAGTLYHIRVTYTTNLGGTPIQEVVPMHVK